MQLNPAEQTSSATEAGLDEPHFDEATLLSARPVVPLEAVKAQSRSRMRLALVSAIVVALLVGAVGATLVYSLRSSGETGEVTEIDDSSQQNPPSIEAGVAAFEDSEPAPPSTQVGADQPVTNNSTSATPPLKASTVKVGRKTVKPETNKPVRQDESREAELARQRELEKEIRRDEKWEERRLRRVERRRNNRYRQRRPSADLSRIRDIFEGSRP